MFECGTCTAVSSDDGLLQEIVNTVNDMKQRDLSTQKEAEFNEQSVTVKKLKDIVKDQASEIAKLKSLKQPKDTSTFHVPLLKEAQGSKRTKPQSHKQTSGLKSSVHDASSSSDKNGALFAERESGKLYRRP